MNKIVISLYETYPPASGCANVTFNFTRYLTGKKYLFQFSTKKGEETLSKDFIIKNFYLPSHKRIKKIITLIKELPGLIIEIKKIKPGYIFLEGASGAILLWYLFLYLKHSDIKIPLVYHSHNVEYELRKQKERGIITFLSRLAERNLVNKAHLTTAVSREDAVKFKKLYGVNPYILPNGVDIEKFENISNDEVEKIKEKYNLKGTILFFMGLTDYKPNKEAIDFLIKNIMPDIIKKYPDVKLALIGGEVNFNIEWLINPGSIPFKEVPPFIKACDICVAPIFSGSGTRLKILEYLAAGKPVVATGKSAEGLELEKGRHFLQAETVEEFIEKLEYLLKNPEKGRKLGREGEKIVEERYSWKKIMADFNCFIEERF
ncbi:MAG: glycosyltransferase family 4 protein [candidate division WOR-3 bacterium]